MTELTPNEIDLIIQALEFFADEGGGMGDLEIDEVRALANKLAREIAIEPEPIQ